MAPVEVMLLGPPRVERGGAPVAFDTRKAVALLAHLALADRPRPRDVLAELLWPEHDAEHARGALRRTLSTLRSAIGAEALESTRDRVALLTGPELEVDVHRFRALTAGGDLEAAVALFRGDFLEGFGLRDAPAFEDWQRGEADALRRELATALGRLVDAREAAGDHAGALAHARRRLALDPLHEPAHRALIRLLALTGDRAGALAQYRECVRTLSRELGVPPLEETTRLYEAISEGTGDAPRPGDAAGAPPALGPSPLVGRDADRRALVAAYEEAAARGHVAIVEGEAGVGKTRLAEDLLAHAGRAGACTLTGRGYEDESGLAYAPVVEALRARLRRGREWLAAVPAPALAEAARLLPELGSPPPPEGPGAEARFLAGLWETLTAAAAGPVPGVLLVDDAQWADEATLGLLAYGLRRLEGRPLLVLVVWRTPHGHPLLRTAGATRVRLDRLGRDDVRALLPDGAPDELLDRLYAETEGLPFLLVEYLAALRDPGAAEEWALPAGARDLLRARLDPVSETARQVLSAAAAIGRSFDVETVREASGRGEEETVAALEELVARGLVREGESGYDFGHAQLRDLVYEETGLARRRLLHGRIAAALGAAGREGATRSAAVARHLALAGRDGDAAREHVRAAEHARAVHANAQALEHVRAALALGHPDRAALHAAAGDLQTLMGDYGGALASYETAAADSGPAELPGLEHRLGRLHHRRGEWALAQAHLEAALDATAEDADAARATILADLSLAVLDGGDPARAAELAREARALAEAAGAPHALGQAHNLLGLLATGDGDLAAARDHLQRSLELAEAAGDPAARAAALNNLALARRAGGEHGEAIELTRAALELCRAQGDRHREAALRNNLADLLHAAGRREEAMEELKRAVALFAEVGAGDGPQPGVWMLARW
jgi:DNA-binding SARP family transcriptional activator